MHRPKHLDPLAERVLSLLSGRPEAHQIILGGYFALQHYLDYRTTHDIDAWWSGRADPAVEKVIREVMQQVAREKQMTLRERRFGDTLSFELLRDEQQHFSFQIASRSITVEEPQLSAWPPLRIETLGENIGAKMNALVNRGAPRDFLDVHAVVDAGLLTPERCWELWEAKNPGGAPEAAKRNVLLHLAGLESRRPLDSVSDPSAREEARRIRQWFKDVFVRG
ncbi:MAG TPA: nucleotidyl transferase AbiEii/AbiGii toxin family protein [Vicinamibacterales bacterium]|jgi:hypothetical protein|nr:nucleotidyl transferase AbiEii/AbiGii toxin family protein [Vicinamibacterales bacterium]